MGLRESFVLGGNSLRLPRFEHGQKRACERAVIAVDLVAECEGIRRVFDVVAHERAQDHASHTLQEGEQAERPE